MKISENYAEHLYRENLRMEKELRQSKKDNEWLLKCLYMALRQTNALVLTKDFDKLEIPELKFELDENISDEMIIRVRDCNGK